MVANIVEFPSNLFITDRADPYLEFNTRSGGIAMDGSEQIISPLSERWKFRIQVPVINAGQARALRVVRAKLQGRFNYLLLSLCDPYGISRRSVSMPPYPEDSVSHSDGAYFSDGTGYGLSRVRSIVAASASENATSVRLRKSDFGGAMTAGVFFSIDFWLYQVDAWEEDGTDYVVEISPPLRAAAIVGAEADFSGKSLWRMASDDGGTADLSMGKFGGATINLVEPVGRD